MGAEDACRIVRRNGEGGGSNSGSQLGVRELEAVEAEFEEVGLPGKIGGAGGSEGGEIGGRVHGGDDLGFISEM